jgi:4-amino-4-deoxy-L-arabinose transferase-like glycosyltransferase
MLRAPFTVREPVSKEKRRGPRPPKTKPASVADDRPAEPGSTAEAADAPVAQAPAPTPPVDSAPAASAPTETPAVTRPAPTEPPRDLEPSLWAFAAGAPLLFAVLAGVVPPLLGMPRLIVAVAAVALSAALAAILLFVPLALAHPRLSAGQRAGWALGLIVAAPLVAPAFLALVVRPAPSELRAKIADRWAHIARGAGLLGTGALWTFLFMANEKQIERGPLWGMLTMLLALVGLLDLFGLWRAGGERVSWRETALAARDGEPLWLSPVLTVPVALLVLFVGIPMGGYEHLPIVLVIALAALLPSAVRRPGLLVFVVSSALYLPFLGVYGLWDPWETHYGEVAREILSRDDWISLWWAQEDWFWSKPILIFWSEALSMGALGVDFRPDANPAHPEWAIRLPHYLLSTGALLSVYALISRVVSKRAGVITALVLATTPHFFLLAHQAITDMPFVACMTMAMSMLGLAVVEDPERQVKRYALGPITVSGRHLLLAGISAVVLPQVLYLVSRNVAFMESLPPFGWHGDVFLHGSAGNHGIPGNAPVHNVEPYLSGPGAQPITQGLLWLLGYGVILFLLRKETRAQSLYVYAFYLFCGLAFMAKGIPGFALPGLVALLFLIGAKRWDLLLEGRLRVAAGILVVLVTGLPWYVAMYIRHGPPFTERLLIHDHINRLTAGVHGDTGSLEYFVEQLGYGLFPWIALAPLALAGWLELRGGAAGVGGPSPDAKRRELTMLIALWLAGAFTLFSAMTTKFHHYIFPAVPPAAILVGLTLDKLFGAAAPRFSWRAVGVTTLGVLAPAPAVLGVAGLWGDVRGVIPADVTGPAAADWVLGQPWSTSTSLSLLLLGVLLFAAAVWLHLGGRAEAASPASAEPPTWKPAAVTTGLLAAPVLAALVGRDMSWITDARPQGYERLIHLFVYNYDRPWPEHLDYRPILTAFAIVATVIVLASAVTVLRPLAARAYLGVALAFTVWALDVYLIDLSPHWGQRELVQRYYELRTGPEEPLVAWQMNWKGENFYTGNRVSVFVQLDNRELTTWVDQRPGTTAYFMLEHSRLGSLRSAVRNATFEEITDTRLNNKFILVRGRIQDRPARPGLPARPVEPE